jgi:hypothetical protein
MKNLEQRTASWGAMAVFITTKFYISNANKIPSLGKPFVRDFPILSSLRTKNCFQMCYQFRIAVNLAAVGDNPWL